MYVICLNTDKVKISRNKLIEKLYKYGITSQVHYIPAHHQPFYKKYSKLLLIMFKETEWLWSVDVENYDWSVIDKFALEIN